MGNVDKKKSFLLIRNIYRAHKCNEVIIVIIIIYYCGEGKSLYF